jgi:hypothetical protein
MQRVPYPLKVLDQPIDAVDGQRIQGTGGKAATVHDFSF